MSLLLNCLLQGVGVLDEINTIVYHSTEDTASTLRSVMIGRAVYERPWQLLGTVDTDLFGESQNPAVSRRQVLQDYIRCCEEIAEKNKADGRRQPGLRTMLKPVLNLFHGECRGRKWKAFIDQELKSATSLRDLFQKTIEILPEDVLDRPPGSEPRTGVDVFQMDPMPSPVTTE